jgi:hypothetical protein
MKKKLAIVATGTVAVGAMAWRLFSRTEADKKFGTKGRKLVYDAVHALPTHQPYFWEQSENSPGVPFDIIHKGQSIVKSNNNVHCSGTTFTSVWVAGNRMGLFNDMSPAQVKDFQLRWFGARGDTERQQGPAMERLGIGGPIKMEDAAPGDFVQLWRKSGTGHSVIFLDWVRDEDTGNVIGFKYRSAQGKGIGTTKEFFSDTPGGAKYGVNRARTYFSRLASKPLR